jgi:hypothetical protein
MILGMHFWVIEAGTIYELQFANVFENNKDK